jgi:hypothetical protein
VSRAAKTKKDRRENAGPELLLQFPLIRHSLLFSD